MGHYSIKELERLSGIKAHTLRIWEKRHNIISPSRTSTNIRYYSDEDLKKVINISILKRNGLKIGTIANLNNKQLTEKIEELHELNSSPQFYEDQLLIALLELDELKFQKLLNNLILKHGFEHVIGKIIFPFLDKVGIMWLTSSISPANEHFLSNLIRQKIIVAIDSLPVVEDRKAPKVILFLPENEMHELGLLFYQYVLRKNKCHTLYLGQLVPIHDLLRTAKILDPNVILTSFSTEPESITVVEILSQLSTNLPNCSTYVTGYQLRNYNKKLPTNIKLFSSAEELKGIYTS